MAMMKSSTNKIRGIHCFVHKTLLLTSRSMTKIILALALLPVLASAQTQKFASHFSFGAPEIPAPLMKEAAGRPWTGEERGPVANLKVFATEKSGAVWLGSEQGAARFDAKASHRWDRW